MHIARFSADFFGAGYKIDSTNAQKVSFGSFAIVISIFMHVKNMYKNHQTADLSGPV